MEEDKRKFRSMNYMMAMFALMGLAILWQSAKESGQENILVYIREFPLSLLVLVLPLASFFIFFVRGNSRAEIISFLRDHFMKYLFKYMGYLLTVLLAYFIIIPYEITDFKDFLILSIILIAGFIIFLLAEWMSEVKFKPLTKKIVMEILSHLFKTLLLVFVPTMIFTLAYYLLSKNSFRVSFLIGVLHSMFLFIGLSPSPEKTWKKLITVIPFGLFQPILLFLATTSKQIDFSLATFVIASIIGLFITYAALLYSIFGKNTPLMKKINKIFDELNKYK